ncbi:hypothetical protein J1605_022762 [Eschrichtius robustus]|uniref:Calx-beta domain-containing protein n=1 Tax=Eschrichtius robustus TaxID=9764 RepID=A0AB34H9K5_ESCRO|nr:hypothetical protein J1605_022762 [Eschrichtius robustus]
MSLLSPIVFLAQDQLPSMQFAKDLLLAKEKEGVLHVPIIRSGDLSYESSVRCYTQGHSAQVMEDFEERRNTDSSRITFLKGEKMKNCTVYIHDDSMFEPEEQFRVYLGHPLGNHWSGARVGKNNMATITISNDEDAPTIEFEEAAYQVREPSGPDATAILNIKVIRRGDQNRTSKIRCSTRDGSAQSGVDYYPKSRILKFSPGVDHIFFKVEILSNEDREWHESFSLVLGPDDPVEAVLGDVTTATVTILDQEVSGSLILPAPPIVVTLADYDHVEEVTKEGVKKSPSPGYPLVCVTPCDPHFPKYAIMKERCSEAGINQTSVQFSWEVATPTDGNGARSPFETITDNTPFTSVNHMVLDSIYFSRRFHVRCVAKAVDKVGHVGTPLRSNIVTIGTDSAICHTPVVAGTARGFQAQSFIANLKYLDVKHKEHPNRIHISVQIPHQDGMLPLISTMPLHNLHFLLSESIYRHQHVCSNLVTTRDLRGISEAGFLDDRVHDSTALGPGYDRPFQFDASVREPKTIQLYKHLNLKSCVWTFDAYYDMTELIDVCGGSVTADFQVRDSAQSFLTVHVPLYVSYIYVTAPRGWASLEHHSEMEFSFFYDTVLWRTGIQTDSVLSARLQIIRIYIREDGRLVIEFKTHAKFRGQFVIEHHTLPDVKSFILTPDHLGGIEFDLQLLWSAQTFDSPYQLWRATSSYNRKDYSGEYTIYLIPCTVQPTQPWVDPGEKPLACTAHAPERFLIPIAFQQTNRPVPVVYSLNTEFQLCNNEKVFLMDPNTSDMSLAEMDYKGAFSKGQILYGRVLWNPEQNLNSAYKLQLEKVYLCTGKDGYVPFFDPTGTIYNEGPQYGCIQPNKHLKHRFLLLDRSQPEVTDKYFHDVPFEAHFASELPDFHVVSSMPGVDGFTLKVDALYKVEAGHQWYLQVIYIIGPDTVSGPRVQRSLTAPLRRNRRDLVDPSGWLTLDESLIYDNEGDQVKNGTNMKSLNLEMEEPAVAASLSQTGASISSALAAIMLLLLVFLVACFITRKCQKQRKKPPTGDILEEYPLNTKVDVPKRGPDRVEKNVDRQYCTVRNVNVLGETEGAYVFKGPELLGSGDSLLSESTTPRTKQACTKSEEKLNVSEGEVKIEDMGFTVKMMRDEGGRVLETPRAKGRRRACAELAPGRPRGAASLSQPAVAIRWTREAVEGREEGARSRSRAGASAEQRRPGRTPSLAALPHARSRGRAPGKFSLPARRREPRPPPRLPRGSEPGSRLGRFPRERSAAPGQRWAGTHAAYRPGCGVQGLGGLRKLRPRAAKLPALGGSPSCAQGGAQAVPAPSTLGFSSQLAAQGYSWPSWLPRPSGLGKRKKAGSRNGSPGPWRRKRAGSTLCSEDLKPTHPCEHVPPLHLGNLLYFT